MSWLNERDIHSRRSATLWKSFSLAYVLLLAHRREMRNKQRRQATRCYELSRPPFDGFLKTLEQRGCLASKTNSQKLSLAYSTTIL